jgi:cytochrome b6-f complex iron-sulfur subunit
MSVTPGDSNPSLSRRDFLEGLWKGLLTLGGLLGLGALSRYLDHSDEPARPTVFDLGPAENYAPGSRTSIPEAEAILLHTDDGFHALSAICPHLGCTVDVAPDGFLCRCHSSRFDSQGRVTQGPAASSLRVLRVEQAANGHLVLHTTG